MWRVLIVEDDLSMREFFTASVLACDQLTLAASVGTFGEAGDCLDAIGFSVDVLLVDLGLPDGSGLDLIRRARLTHPHCEALVISVLGDEDNVLASIEAGALGYIHKDSPPDDIAQTIVEMKSGASPISPMIARRVLNSFRSLQSKNVLNDALNNALAHTEYGQTATKKIADEVSYDAGGVQLTPREQGVLELIARGFSYQDIAGIQSISVHTVQSHIKNLYGKLAVHSRGQAVFEATRRGLLP
jgi:DNA-binding NarL/FixJ family response regulator